MPQPPTAPSGRAEWTADSPELDDVSVGELLSRTAARTPDEVALIEGTPGPRRRRWTYRELLDGAERVASVLLTDGRPGDRVGIWADNSAEWIFAEFGVALAGMTLVTINPALRREELRHILADAGLSVLLLLEEYRGNPMGETWRSLAGDFPGVRAVYIDRDWDGWIASSAALPRLPVVSPDDCAQIQYTSGTTGPPRGAMLHHRGLVNNARLSYVSRFRLGRGDALVNAMPLFHTAGCALATLAPVWASGCQVLMPSFDPALMVTLLEEEHSVGMGGVPTMLRAVLAAVQGRDLVLPRLRFAFSGGAPVDPDLVTTVEGTFGVPMLIIYAQTEASPGITMTALDDAEEDRARTVGRPLAGAEVKIVDPRTGETVGYDAVGELCTHGVMLGYLGPDRVHLDADGWLHTGDLARMDRRGYCRISGRAKDIIIRGGENVYPWEIEQVLLSHPAVGQVAVVGVPDQHWGEQVAAVLQMPPGTLTPSLETELTTYCRDRLAPYKVPRIWASAATLPMTGSGKIQKFAVQAQLRRQRQEGSQFR